MCTQNTKLPVIHALCKITELIKQEKENTSGYFGAQWPLK